MGIPLAPWYARIMLCTKFLHLCGVFCCVLRFDCNITHPCNLCKNNKKNLDEQEKDVNLFFIDTPPRKMLIFSKI